MALQPSKSDFVRKREKTGWSIYRSVVELKSLKDEFLYPVSHLGIVTKEFCSVIPKKLRGKLILPLYLNGYNFKKALSKQGDGKATYGP